MSAPFLIAVEDDAVALAALEAQLVPRYAPDYRIELARGRADALATATRLADAGAEVAMVLVGEPVTGGADDVFEHIRQLHPHAKRALVVSPSAWLDDDAAGAIRASMALGRVDYFVPRPMGPRDEVFHETVSEVLLDWATERRLVPHTVHIVGEEWSGRAYELREVFESCAVPHVFTLASSDQGQVLLERAGPDPKLPVMLLPDGRVLSDPSNAEIAEAAGAPSGFDQHAFDLVIVGAGPAGLSAAVYGASEGLAVVVVDAGGIGGQARSSTLIRNYLGFARGISGSRLAEQAYEQAMVFGASFVFMHTATRLARAGNLLEVSLVDGRAVTGRAVILATGATYRRLGVPSLEALTGAGVFYGGASSEAPSLVGRDVFIAGGGNSAGQAALHLARYARHVTLVIRGPSLEAGMSQYLVPGLEAAPNVDLRTSTEVVGGGGEGRLEHLVLRNRERREDETVAADALFVLIGAHPQTDWLPAGIATDRHGFLLTGHDVPERDWPLDRLPLALETSMPGVFAAGDVRHASVKRVASAVGEGSVAIRLVQSHFSDAVAFAPPAIEHAAPA